MAILLTQEGERKQIQPKDKKFTLKEISNIINSLCEVFFINSWVVFKAKRLKGQNLKKNQKASNFLKMPVYGDCLLAKENELSECFFFPSEILEKMVNEIIEQKILEMNSMSQMDKNEFDKKIDINDYIKEMNQKNLKSIDENVQKFSPQLTFFSKLSPSELDYIYNEAFEKIRKNYEENNFKTFQKNFVIFNTGIDIIFIKQIQHQKIFFEDLIIYFSQKEEFEKCAFLQKVFQTFY